MKYNPLIKSWIRGGRFIFIYGEAGTGKSHIALNFLKIASQELGNSKVCLIATEIGTLALLRSYPPKRHVKVLFAPAPEFLLNGFLECLLNKKYIIVDTINSLYEGDKRVLKIIGLISSLSRLSSSGVLALGQVRESEEMYPAAWQAILPWAEIIGRTAREKDKYLVILEKPRRGVLAFKIKDGEIEWL
jgi:energy-coupling factor transporter ATP-binding protein EcfA2